MTELEQVHEAPSMCHLALAKELKEKDSEIQEIKQNITSVENKLNDLLTKMKHNEEKQAEEP